MPGGGGLGARMTWLGPDVIVRGWTPDGHILFVTTYGQPFFRNYRAYTLDPDGGLPELAPVRPGQPSRLAPGRTQVIGRNTADPARWKRYRAAPPGTCGSMPKAAASSGGWTSCPATSPARCGWATASASCRTSRASANLYSCRPDGSDRRRHTDHDDFYARHAQTDGERIVYQCGARHLAVRSGDRPDGASDIQVLSHRTQAARRFVEAEDHLGTFRCIRPATAWPSTCAARCSASRSGKARCANGATRRRALPARPVARRRSDVRRRQRRLGRGAAPGLRRR